MCHSLADEKHPQLLKKAVGPCNVTPNLRADHICGWQPEGAPVLQAERLVGAGHRQDRAEGEL